MYKQIIAICEDHMQNYQNEKEAGIKIMKIRLFSWRASGAGQIVKLEAA